MRRESNNYQTELVTFLLRLTKRSPFHPGTLPVMLFGLIPPRTLPCFSFLAKMPCRRTLSHLPSLLRHLVAHPDRFPIWRRAHNFRIFPDPETDRSPLLWRLSFPATDASSSVSPFLHSLLAGRPAPFSLLFHPHVLSPPTFAALPRLSELFRPSPAFPDPHSLPRRELIWNKQEPRPQRTPGCS